MEPIVRHSLERAADEAVRLWALASAQYPRRHDLILETVRTSVVEVVSAFSLNARRAIEALPRSEKFALGQPRWKWAPTAGGEVVTDLWGALNRVIHARKLDVGFVELPEELSVISGGAVVVPFVQAETDRKTMAFIDPFALAYAFLYDVFPRLVALGSSEKGQSSSIH
jgi:hypothetical protein